MGISSVTGNGSYSAGPMASDSTSLEKQLQKLQAQLKQESESKDDSNTKEVKVQRLEQQIKQIEQKIAQQQAKSAGGGSQPKPNEQESTGLSAAEAVRSASGEAGTIDILI